MLLKKGFLVLILTSLGHIVKGQHTFVQNCVGTWKGQMYIYRSGSIKDSVEVRLTVAPMSSSGEWTWKTEYLSSKMPMVKDYKLKTKDASKGIYIIDEGDGIELINYLFDNKLYCLFETQGISLTATYELRGEELIFEVTSGKKQATKAEVTNFSVDNLQKVVLKRANSHSK